MSKTTYTTPMKTILMSVFVMVALCSFGQGHQIGIVGSAHWSYFHTSGSFQVSDYRLAPGGGMTYGYVFDNGFSLGTGLLFTPRGWTTETIFTDDHGIPTGGKSTNTMEHNYFSLPIKAGFQFGGRVVGMVHLGVMPSWLYSAHLKVPEIEVGGIYEEAQNTELTYRHRRWDLAAFAEIGGGYNIGERFMVFTALAYVHSLNSFSTENYFVGKPMSHYALTWSVGLNFILNNKE